jgi:hypothetical protein
MQKQAKPKDRGLAVLGMLVNSDSSSSPVSFFSEIIDHGRLSSLYHP